MRYTDKKAAKYFNRLIGELDGDLANAWGDNFGRWYACDGYRAYRVERKPDGLEEIWSVKKCDPKKRDETRMKIEEMFDREKMSNLLEIPVELADVPTSGAKEYDPGDNFPVINRQYLREAMEMLPGGKVYCENGPQRMIRPVYVISDDGVALILPIRTWKWGTLR